MNKEKENTRSRTFFCVSYLSKELLERLLTDKLNIIKRYAYIVHDKDLLDGNPKKEHIHLYIKFNEKKSIKQIRDYFSTDTDNTLADICKNDCYALRYLLHLDDGSKFQYDRSAVTSYNIPNIEDYWDGDVASENREFDALQELYDGVSPLQVARKYGRDFIYHYNHYRQLLADIYEYELKHSVIDENGEIKEEKYD